MARSSVIKVSLLGDAKDLKRAFNEAEVSAKSWTGKMAGFAGNVIGFFADIAKKVALSVLAIAGAIAAIAIKGGITRALDTEDATAKMRRLGLTTEEIAEAIDAVDQAFDGTVFTNPEGFALFAKLQGLGVELGEIPGVISLIADAAAFGNVPLGQMDDIFSKIISNGKLSGEELNRLADAGIPLTELAGALGLTVPELRKMVTAGELTSEMFLEAMGSMEQFEGAAKAAGDTTRGAWANVQSQLKKLGELFVGPLFGENGPMVKLFKATREALIELRPTVQKAGEALGNWLVPKMEKLAEWLSGGGLPRLIENIKTKFSEWKDKLSEIWPYVQDGIAYVKDLFDRIKEGENPLKGVVEGFAMLGGPLMILARELLPALAPLFQAIVPPLAELANAIAPALAEILGVLVKEVLPGLVIMIEGVATWLGENGGFVKALVIAGVAFKIFTIIVNTNPFILLATAVILIATLIVTHWTEIKAFFKRTWDWIKETVASVGKWFKDKWNEAVEFVTNLILNWTILGRFIKHFDQIKETVRNVVAFFREKWDALIEWFKAIPGRVSSALKNMWTLVKAGATAVREWIKDRFNDVIDWLRGLPGRAWSALQGLFDGVRDAFKSAINWIIDKWNAFRIRLGGQTVTLPFGMSFSIPQFTLNTPNIPRLHQGGVFRAPMGQSEGLALLRDRERVSVPEGAGQIVLQINASRRDALDGWAIIEALQRIESASGPLPIRVRTA